MGKLKVVKAAYAGACYGVQRALDMTLKAAEAGGSVCTHPCRWCGYSLARSGASGHR